MSMGMVRAQGAARGLSVARWAVMPKGGRVNVKGVVGMVLLVLLAAAVMAGCQRRSAPQAQHFTDFSLGTVITLTFYDGSRTENGRTAERLFSYARGVEERMSTSQADYTDSELLISNRNAGIRPTVLSADTVAVLAEGVRLSQLTDGAFQIGIWPLTQLWDFSALIDAEDDKAAALLLPSAEEIAAALPFVTHQGVQLDSTGSAISFSEKSMGVDVGGIAKGWVGMRFRDELKRAGVQRALIDIGGNIVTVGEGPTNSRAWKIGIQDPTAPQGEVLGALSIGESAVVTSGDYERFIVVDKVRYHHIIDPTTGVPVANQLSSVTIVAADSTEADALSTAVYVKGLAHGKEFIDQQKGIEALFVTKDNMVILTDGLRSSFTLHSDAFTVIQ